MKPMPNRDRKKLRAACLAALLILSCLPAGLGAAETADTVRESGAMIVGVRSGYLPFSEATVDGEEITFSGFDVDLARAVAERIGVETRFVVVEPAVIIPMTAESIIQVAPGINHRMSWERVIDFSVTYMPGGTRALVLASTGIYSLSSLRAKRVAVAPGTDEAELQVKLPGITAVAVDTPDEGFALLVNREVTALIGDFRDLVHLASESKRPAGFRIIKEPIVPAPIALGLPPEDGAWRELVDRALMDLWTSGRYAEIYKTWFGGKSGFLFPLDFTMEVWPK